MNFTNKYNIPEHIATWLTYDEYDYVENTLSATTLISPPRAWALKLKHKDELVQDVSDLIKLRYGTAIHDSIEKCGAIGANDLQEERFFAEIDGFTISGKMDGIINGIIRDTKSTSVWKIVHSDFDDYIKQLSIYKWLLFKNGIETAYFGMIDFFFTDWKKSDALKGGDYPVIPYAERKINLLNLEDTEKYIKDRICEFAFARLSLPRCTDEDLWRDETKWACKKKGNLKATKVCTSLEEAEDFAKEKGLEIEERKGKVKRCLYCTARPFCDQAKELEAEGVLDAE